MKAHNLTFEVVERAEGADEVEATFPKRAPEALHLTTRGCVIGLGVDERGSHPRTGQTQCLAAISGAVVKIQGVGWTMLAQRLHHQTKHIDLALGVMGNEPQKCSDSHRRECHECAPVCFGRRW